MPIHAYIHTQIKTWGWVCTKTKIVSFKEEDKQQELLLTVMNRGGLSVVMKLTLPDIFCEDLVLLLFSFLSENTGATEISLTPH